MRETDLVERCGALAREGLSDAQIADRLGIHKDTARKNRGKAGVRRPHAIVTPEQVAIINRLADDGVSVNEIARTVGISWPSVAKRRPDAVWTPREVVEWATFHRRIYRGAQ